MLCASESNCTRIIASPLTIIYTYTQRAYCDHQPADCCSEHAFPTLLSQLTSPASAGSAGFARPCFVSACVRSNLMQLRSDLSSVTIVINGFKAWLETTSGLLVSEARTWAGLGQAGALGQHSTSLCSSETMCLQFNCMPFYIPTVVPPYIFRTARLVVCCKSGR